MRRRVIISLEEFDYKVYLGVEFSRFDSNADIRNDLHQLN